MEQITSPDWLARMSLPANLETLKVALAVRRDALELARLRDIEAHDHGKRLLTRHAPALSCVVDSAHALPAMHTGLLVQLGP
jgi:hypothetical protein